MTVTEQVEALQAFAVNPINISSCRDFWRLMMLPVLSIFADLIGIMLGGFVITRDQALYQPCVVLYDDRQITGDQGCHDGGCSRRSFWRYYRALVGCHQGLNVRSGAERGGKGDHDLGRGFVHSIIMVDCLFTTLLLRIARIMIEISHLHKSFGNHVILNDLNLTIKEGETKVIIGRSGTGKSVLLKNIIGILPSGRRFDQDQRRGSYDSQQAGVQ